MAPSSQSQNGAESQLPLVCGFAGVVVGIIVGARESPLEIGLLSLVILLSATTGVVWGALLKYVQRGVSARWRRLLHATTLIPLGVIPLLAHLSGWGLHGVAILPPPTTTTSGRPNRLQGFLNLDELPWGAVAFSIPEHVPHDATVSVEALLSPIHTVVELQDMIAADAQGLDIKVSPIMTAKLVGDSFQIGESTPATQAIAVGSPTRWQWDITPKPGMYDAQLLTLSIWARVQVRGTDAEREVRTLRREVKVLVGGFERAAGFVGTNWQWFASGLAAIAAFGAKRRWFPEATSK